MVLSDSDVFSLAQWLVDNTNVIVRNRKNGNGRKSFYYAHCPERAIPGKTLYEMVYNDRIIGGLDDESAKKVKKLYSSFVKGNIYVTDPKTAEFIKLMENTFRELTLKTFWGSGDRVNPFGLCPKNLP